jgi:N-acyl-D-aspartate/D-glutamate deacylase
MEGVEGIPGPALRAGIDWDWETVGEYLDALDRRPLALDVAAQIAHGAVRAFVMGERGAANEPADADDIARMAEIVRAGVAAGAIGLSVNRLELHKAKDGREVPGTFADLDEIFALAHAVAAGSRHAVFSTILPQAAGGDGAVWNAQLDWIARLSRETGLAVTFPFGASTDGSDTWRRRLARIEHENAAGARLHPQVGSHRQGLLCGLRTLHPFLGRPSYTALAHLAPAERAARMADPAVKAAILAEHAAPGTPRLCDYMLAEATAVFPPAPRPEHEPDPATSLAARAAALGRDPQDLLYDWTIADGGEALVHFFLGGYPGSLDASLELMAHPTSVLGLGDGGAHVDVICDCGYPSFVLSYWVRDRDRGTLPLETAIEVLTREPARLFGLHDRGVVAPGYKADLNVLDPAGIRPRPLEIVDDLPTGARRIVQRADGFVATIVDGVVVQRNGTDTGARPGRVVRNTARAH